MMDYGHVAFGLIFIAIYFWAVRAIAVDIPIAWVLYFIGFFLFVLIWFV
jgi:hypothetical protein